MRKKQWTAMMVCAASLAMLSATALRAGMSDVKGTFERTLNVTGPVDLEVTTGSGDISVVSGGVNEVHIKGIIHVNHGWTFGVEDYEGSIHAIERRPPIQQNGNHIQIGPLTDPALARHVSIDYEITAPARTQLTSRSGSGDLTVRGIAGPVNANTGSGDLKLGGLRGDVHVRTGSGNGDFEDISGGHLVVESGSGDIQCRNIRAELHVRTGSGNVKAQGQPTGQWILSTGSGDVTLSLPPMGGFDLDASTDSGDIDTNLPITVQGKAGGHELTGQVRGGGHLIRLRTGSGDIRID